MLALLCATKIPPSRQNNKPFLFALVVLFAALICGLGDMLGGYDRYIYCDLFDSTAEELRNAVPYEETSAIALNPTEQGYGWFNILIAKFTRNRYIFILTTTLLIYLMIYRHLIKYTPYPFIAFFVLLCLFYFFTFTYLRQVLACCIAWFAIPFAQKRKPIKFFAITVLAATFHNTALLFGIVYFVANRKFTIKSISILFIIGLLLGFTPLGQFLMDNIGGSVNEYKAEQSARAAGGQPRLAYFIEAAFFLIIILSRYKKLPKEGMQLCLLNIALTFIFILIFFIRFTDGGRLSWYFIIGIVCTTAQVIVHDYKDMRNKLIIYSICLFLYVRIILGWGIALTPYKTFLTNGVREDDFIWEKYEYDHLYDEDKFYNMYED